MTSYVESSELRLPLGQVVETRLRRSALRAQKLREVAGILGVARTAKLGLVRIAHGKEYPITVSHADLDHPLHITSALADVCNAKEVLTGGAYALPPSMHDKLNGKPIVDVGAFIGISAAYLASQYKQSKVTAIEPLARNYDLLQRNAEEYGGQIQPVQAALLADAGPAKIVGHHIRHPYMPLFASSDIPTQRGEESSLTTFSPQGLLDSLDNIDEIGILKIDIEGAEGEIFAASAMGAVLARTSVLLIETHDQFVAGSSLVVARAAQEAQMQASPVNDHTMAYSRL